MKDDFSLVNLTKTKRLYSYPFLNKSVLISLKNEILGENYSISIVLIDEVKSKEINKKYRNKNNATNVLSFSLSLGEGEILLCPDLIKKESMDKNKKFGKSFKNLLYFLVIHGMLHLKGMRHSEKMKKLENFYCKKFKFNTI